MRHLVAWVSLIVLAGGGPVAAGDREEMLRKDRERVEAGGFWIYNDLARGKAEAKESAKPLAVVLRCIPCVECVRLDEDLVDTDARLRALLDRFVRVRLICTNGLDLSTFQFDTDQSFAVFLMREDGTIYGRYGTRSDRKEWAGDVSVEGLAAALEGALEMHAAWPRDREALAGKRGGNPAYASPEQFPSLRERYGATLAADGPRAPSCIHCHQIGEARHAELLKAGTFPDEELYPFPHPKAVGLILDPHRRAVVADVVADTPAAASGFRKGDEILALSSQPILSMADVQWVLHAVPASGGSVKADVRRDGATVAVTLALPDGWRRADDISWRASTWQLRGEILGDMMLERVDDALVVKFVVRGGRAGRTGIRKGDVLVSLDGQGFTREADLIRYLLDPARRGHDVPLRIRRGDEVSDLVLPAK